MPKASVKATSSNVRKNPGPCIAKIDRICLNAERVPPHDYLVKLGFRRDYDRWITDNGSFKPFNRACGYTHQELRSKMSFSYERTVPFLPECTISISPSDQIGQLRPELEALFTLFIKPQLSRVELAFDFERSSGVDRTFVLKHGLFGKSRIRTSRKYPESVWFGSRRSSKFIRAYPKPGIADFRVELEFHRSFLRDHKIASIADLARLAELVNRKHFVFCRIDPVRFRTFAKRHIRYSESVLRVVSRRNPLNKTLAVLRTQFGLRNLHRHLEELPENAFVARALRVWASDWKKAGVQ